MVLTALLRSVVPMHVYMIEKPNTWEKTCWYAINQSNKEHKARKIKTPIR